MRSANDSFERGFDDDASQRNRMQDSKRRRLEGAYGLPCRAIAIGSDHAGFGLKKQIIAYINEKYQGKVSVKDWGTTSEEARVDYPDIAGEVCGSIIEGTADRGILLDGAGVASGIAANKFNGIRAGVVHDHFSVSMARKHNDANVICLGGKTLGIEAAKEIVDVFVTCEFEGERHVPRLKKLEAVERSQAFSASCAPEGGANGSGATPGRRSGALASPFKLPL